MLTRSLLALIALLLAFTPSSSIAQSTNIVIRVGTGPDDQSTPILYASKYGLYQKAGLDVQIQKLAGSSVVSAAIAGGSLDMGKSASLGVITAIGKGLPFTIVSNLAYYDSRHPDTVLVVATNSPVKSAKDLQGATLAAVSLQDMNAVGTFAWLDQYGVDKSTVKYVEVPAATSLAAMEQGRVVGSTLYEPFLSAFLATGKVRILGYPFDAIAKHFSQGVIYTSKSFAAAHPDAIAKFLKATDEAARYLATHEDVSSQLSAEFGGVEVNNNIRHAERGIPLDPNELQPVINAAAKYGVIPKAFPAMDAICSCAMMKK